MAQALGVDTDSSPLRRTIKHLPETPVSLDQEQWTGNDQKAWPLVPESDTTDLQSSPPPPPADSSPIIPHSIDRKALPTIPQPEFRLQNAPASPISINPPRLDIQQPESAFIRHASANHADTDTLAQGRGASYPESDGSPASLPIRRKPLEEQQAQPRTSSRHSPTLPQHRSSTASPTLSAIPPPVPEHAEQGLQYHAFDELHKKQPQHRASHMTMRSVGSSSSGGDPNRHSLGHRGSSGQLGVPRTSLSRPASAYTLGVELRGRTLSPLQYDSDHASPRLHARDQSQSRRSPANRPVSYVDLLNNVPYQNQVAPAPHLNNSSLQSAVGKAASLLDTKKTLEMYGANVKKTNDVTIQYEFAIFMINAAREAQPGDGLDPAELTNEAKQILQRLSDRAYPFAQYYLADGYFSGLFNKGKPDFDKAFPLFVAASKHGHAEAGYRAALCYEFNWGTTKSFPKAVQFYRNAAAKNHPGAATRLGLACIQGGMGLARDRAIYREGVKWLKRASESADVQFNTGPYELGLMHLEGDGRDIFKDEAYAAQLLTQSAELGHPEANFLMGRAYENGLYGCPRDAALSVHFYNGAATRGHVEGQMALCAWYMVGAEPVLEKDENEAYAWAKQAADTGYAKAEYAIGYFTEMGIGCRRDPLEANVWYVRAADQGNETAKQRLQIIRAAASGGGVPMSKVAAKSKELGGNGAGPATGGGIDNKDGSGKKKKLMGIF